MKGVLLGMLVLVFIAFSLDTGPVMPAGGFGSGITPEGVTPVNINIIKGVPFVGLPGSCPSCSIFTDRPFLASSINEGTNTISVSMGLIRASGVEAVEGATLFVYIYNAEGNVIKRCRMQTDEGGSASFTYNAEQCEDGCNARTIFCCSDPVGLSCVLSDCLGDESITSFAGISPCPRYEGVATGKAMVGEEEIQLYPTMDEAVIPPKPPERTFAFTFTLCFPILVIFGFLGAAMYASGRDPFAMFSFYTPRFTRGAERPISGRGYSIPGSGIVQLAMTLTKAAKEEITADKLLEQMGQSPLLNKGSGQVAQVGMAAEGGGRGGAAQTTPGGTTGDARAMGQPGGGQVGAPPPIQGSSGTMGAAVGMGFGTAMMNILGLLLYYSNASWLTGALAQKVFEIANKWQDERNAQFAERQLPGILSSMSVTRDNNGTITRITYRDPESGERVTISGAEKCASFVERDINAPLREYSMVNADRAAELMRDFNEKMDLINPVTGARSMLNAELAQGRLSGEVAEAVRVLADLNAKPEERTAAFATLMGTDASADLKIAAFVAATDGMNAGQLSAFLGSEAAHPIMSFLGTVSGEQMLGRTISESGLHIPGIGELAPGALGQLSARDGNLLAAIAAAGDRLEDIGRVYPGVNVGNAAENIRGVMAACAGESFGYREGTESSAQMMVAMGFSSAAMDLRVSLEHIALDALPEDVRAEVEAATVGDEVDVSHLSTEARQTLSGMLQGELETVGSIPGPLYGVDSDKYKDLQRDSRAMDDALGNYERLSQASLQIMGGLYADALAEVRGPVSSSPIVRANGELLAITLPPTTQLAGDMAIAALAEHGLTPEMAGLIVGLDTVNAERQAINAMSGLAQRLTEDPAEYATGIAERAGQQQEQLADQRGVAEAALRMLDDPSTTEGARLWALDVALGGRISETREALQVISDPNASQDQMARAIDLISGGQIGGMDSAIRVIRDSESSQEQREQALTIVFQVLMPSVSGGAASEEEARLATGVLQQIMGMDTQASEAEQRNAFAALADGVATFRDESYQRVVASVDTAGERDAYLRQTIDEASSRLGNPEQREEFRTQAMAEFDRRASELTEMQGRYDAAAAVLSSPTAANAAEYARYLDDSTVPGLAERRDSAHDAATTLSTSTDPAARAEAERTLRNLGVSDTMIDIVISPDAHGTTLQTGVENLNTAIDTLLDERRRMEVNVDDAARLALNYVVYSPENPVSMMNPNPAPQDPRNPAQDENPQSLAAEREGMARAVQAAEAERTYDRNFQIAMRGDAEVRRFYDNMDENRQIAEAAARQGGGGAGAPAWGTSEYSQAAQRTQEARSSGRPPDEEIPR